MLWEASRFILEILVIPFGGALKLLITYLLLAALETLLALSTELQWYQQEEDPISFPKGNQSSFSALRFVFE